MRFLTATILTLFVSFNCQAEGLDEGLKTAADALAPHDIVTGKRLLNIETETAEIQRAEQQQRQILAEARQNGFAVDTDQALLSHLQEMMQRIARVSHRPQLPWEVHLIESPEVNAGTFGGGKIYFFRGLFGGLVDPSNDNEIAAVMAHEMGHDAARHVSKTQSNQLLALFSKKPRNTIYKASFTTLQEDEADRIGLLYMSLAGYDPKAVPPIWQRANQKYGSNPGSYAYDHSLASDRANKTAILVPLALDYFPGQGNVNNNYQTILQSNKLLPRENTSEGGNGFLAALNAGVDTYVRNIQVRSEAKVREIKMQQDQTAQQKQQDQIDAQRLTRLDFKIVNASNGYKALFGHFQNGGDKAITGATITVYYLNAAGQSVYSENVQVQSNYILPRQTANWSAYMQNVPGAPNVQAAVTQVNWAQ